MKKFLVTLLLVVVLILPNFYSAPALSQAQGTTPNQEEALKNYLQQQNQQKAQQQQQSQQNNSQTTQESSAPKNQTSLPTLSKALLIIYILTFLLFWIFLGLWIATLIRWTKQKKTPPVEIGRKLN